MPSARVVVLVSGSGTLLQALLDAAAAPGFAAQVVAVGADRDGIAALHRADVAGVPTFVERVADHADREAWTPLSPPPWPRWSPTSSCSPAS